MGWSSVAVDGVTLSLTTVGITSTVSAFYQMLPPITEIRKRTNDDPTFAADVRIGEVAASVIALGLGAIASSLSGSSVPVLASAVLAGGLIFLYEFVLRSRPVEVNGNA